MDPIELAAATADWQLDPYGRAGGFIGVVDADALLSSIDNHCRNNRPTRLARLGRTPSVRLYGSEHVYFEVYRGLGRFARPDLPVEKLKTCFESDYLPFISWVRTSTAASNDPRVAEVTDETDLPTAILACLVAPCLVYAEDRALRRPGLAPDQWRQAAGHGVRMVEAHTRQQSVTLAVSAPVYGAFKGLGVISKKAGFPGWLPLLLVAAAGVLMLRSPRHRTTLADRLLPVFEFIGEELDRALEAERCARTSLKACMLQPTTAPSPKQMTATVLARSSEPLLAAEIHDEIRCQFGADGLAISDVRTVLREEPEFECVDRYRWQLGRLAGSLPDDHFAAIQARR